MKLPYLKSMAFLAIGLLLASCSGNDDNETITGTGTLGIESDNAFDGNDLILNANNKATSNGEVLQVNQIKYIVSNIVLTAEDGTTFTYPKSNSYFIVDEAYYDLGQAAQSGFAAQAQAAGLLPSWDGGYKFLDMEGTFTASNYPGVTPYTVLTGKTAAQYNYKEVTLNLPAKALVRTDIAPEIHIIADLAELIDGTNNISLANAVSGNAANISDGANVGLITQNLDGVFSVAHVHND